MGNEGGYALKFAEWNRKVPNVWVTQALGRCICLQPAADSAREQHLLGSAYKVGGRHIWGVGGDWDLDLGADLKVHKPPEHAGVHDDSACRPARVWEGVSRVVVCGEGVVRWSSPPTTRESNVRGVKHWHRRYRHWGLGHCGHPCLVCRLADAGLASAGSTEVTNAWAAAIALDGERRQGRGRSTFKN